MPKYTGFVGCWTRPEESSIHVIQLDSDNGTAVQVDVLRHPSPSFLTVSPNQKYLYAGASAQDVSTPQRGAVTSFAIRNDGKLERIVFTASQKRNL